MKINVLNLKVPVVEIAQKISGIVKPKQAVLEKCAVKNSKVAEGNFAANAVKHALFSKLEPSRVKKPSPQQIAERYAPILVLPQGKYNLPGDPNSYIANSRLREDRSPSRTNPFGRDKQYGDNTNGSTDDNFSAADVGRVKDQDYFLDLNNDRRGTLGSRNAPIFYQFNEGKGGKPATITYHIFYPYNDAPTTKMGNALDLIDLNHEGDWERVTIRLNPNTYKPIDALYSAHNGTPKPVAYKDLAKDDKTNRPLVFVANGSHANYTKAGSPAVAHGLAHDQTVVDRNRDGKIDRRDGVVFFDTNRDLREVTSQAWYPKTGRGLHWGEIGVIKDSSGPFGPSWFKGAVGEDK